MGTKAKEIRSITQPGRKHDRARCPVCGPVPKGRITCSRLWTWSMRQPGPVNPFDTTRSSQ
jgi:hypothetical protein